MNLRVLESLQIQPAATVKDVNSSAITGDYVGLPKYGRLIVLLHGAVGTATSGDLTMTLYEAKDNAGTSAQVLAKWETGRIYVKNDTSTLASVGQWTKVTQATALSTYTSATSGEAENLWALEVRGEDLSDLYSHVRVDVAATSSSKIIDVLYILCDPKQPCVPELMADATA